MPAIDMTEVLRSYEDKWVALTEDNKVVGSGDSIKEAAEEAKKKGYDNPIFEKVLPFDGSIAPYII